MRADVELTHGMRVLAIDPAVRNTGYAILEGDPRKPTVLGYDVIHVPKNILQSGALSAIRTHLVHIIKQYQPDEIAVEGIIYVQSHRTAISMGAARAAVMIAAASLPVAGNVYILARHYGVAPQRVSASILISTATSVLTVSAIIAWVYTPPI